MTGQLDHGSVWDWRDYVTGWQGVDDYVGWLAEQDAELVRGEARVVRDGVVEAGERAEYDELVIATGSSPAVPSIDGLADAVLDESRRGLGRRKSRESLAVLGVGPVGAELAQFFRRMGAESVTIVETNDRLLSEARSEAGELPQRFGARVEID